jgi:hypothetical protein
MSRAAFIAVLAPHHRASRVTLLFALSLLLIGVAMAVWGSAQAATVGLPLMVAAALGFWWFLGASRALPLCLDLAAEAAPRLRRAGLTALATQAACSLLPAIALLIAFGIEPSRALLVCWTAALTGLLAASLPSVAVLLLFGLAMATQVLSQQLAPGLDGLDGIFGQLTLAQVALLLSVVSAMLWWRVLRGGPPAGVFRQSLATVMHRAGGFREQNAIGEGRFALWLHSGAPAALPTSTTARLARTLGRPFHTSGWRALLKERTPDLAVLALWLLLSSSTKVGVFATFAPLLMMSYALLPALRLYQLGQRPSAELSELALLPGLPPATVQAKALATLCWQSALRAVASSGLLFLLFLLWIGASTTSLLQLVAAMVAGVAFGYGGALWIASGRSRGVALTAVLALGLWVFGSGIVMSKASLPAHFGQPVLLSWAVFALVAYTAAWLARPALQRLPHPFLVR